MKRLPELTFNAGTKKYFRHHSPLSFFLPFLVISAVVVNTFLACSSSRSVTQKNDGYKNLFEGNSLKGWEYDPVYWRMEDGVLIGEVTPATLLKRNSFIIKKDFIVRDFDLKVDYRISEEGNSGINYRSERIDSLPYAMRGYQADIDAKNRYTGQNYEERGRTILAFRGQKVELKPLEDPSAPLSNYVKNNIWTPSVVTASLGNIDSMKAYIKNGDWNEYHLVVKGNRMQHFVNGVLMSDVTDNDTAHRKFEGLLGVQVHVGPPMKIEYRNFRIKDL